MNKPLLLFVGKSGSGKTTAANYLESNKDFNQLQSYTTRPKRYEDETGHTFITDEEFDKLKNIVAYTEYNGFKYGATKDQIDEVDIYVIDVPGVKTLLKKYKTDRPIYVIYLETSVYTRISRMLDRHDSDAAIVSRLYTDEKYDWINKLKKIINNSRKNVELFIVDANKEQEDVIDQILWYIE